MSARLTKEQKAIHFLNRISFGATPGEVEKVKRLGISPYLENQLHPEAIPDPVLEKKLAEFKTLGLDTRQLFELYPPRKKAKARGMMPFSRMQGPRHVIQELQQARLLRAVYSRRQLYELMVDFWTNHFNVFARKGADKWLITSYDRDTIRPHALGYFRDLLLATAQSPAMLFYLDNWLSVGPQASLRRFRRHARRRIRRGLNENYARELMELHTLGVDGGYSQKDVQEVARCFTGWTIRRPRGEAKFRFAPRRHDRGEKVVLGTTIAPGRNLDDGIQVIDLLARHPSTARFLATKLVRRFVSDNPPQSLVNQAAEAFRRSDGYVPSVLQAIIRAPEFFSTLSFRAKVKKPLELIASALRILGADVHNAKPLLRYLAQMGELPFMARPPTGYADVGPSWVNASALLTRMNFALDLTGSRIRGTTVKPDAQNGDQILPLVASGGLSDTTRAALAKVSGPEGTALLLAAPEFQRR
ncbi:MAG: DUF1800 domain-containing protein [Candidatus Binatia bacterium]